MTLYEDENVHNVAQHTYIKWIVRFYNWIIVLGAEKR